MGKTATGARYSAAVADDEDIGRAAQRLRNEVAVEPLWLLAKRGSPTGR
jgi:hypothetical protein